MSPDVGGLTVQAEPMERCPKHTASSRSSFIPDFYKWKERQTDRQSETETVRQRQTAAVTKRDTHREGQKERQTASQRLTD